MTFLTPPQEEYLLHQSSNLDQIVLDFKLDEFFQTRKSLENCFARLQELYPQLKTYKVVKQVLRPDSFKLHLTCEIQNNLLARYCDLLSQMKGATILEIYSYLSTFQCVEQNSDSPILTLLDQKGSPDGLIKLFQALLENSGVKQTRVFYVDGHPVLIINGVVYDLVRDINEQNLELFLHFHTGGTEYGLDETQLDLLRREDLVDIAQNVVESIYSRLVNQQLRIQLGALSLSPDAYIEDLIIPRLAALCTIQQGKFYRMHHRQILTDYTMVLHFRQFDALYNPELQTLGDDFSIRIRTQQRLPILVYFGDKTNDFQDDLCSLQRFLFESFFYEVSFALADLQGIYAVQTKLAHEENYYEGSPAVSRIAIRPSKELSGVAEIGVTLQDL